MTTPSLGPDTDKQASKPSPKQALGQAGERIAIMELHRKGYAVLAQNWRNGRQGEIDIIAQHGDILAFIEVKTRRGLGFGAPEEAVNHAKQRKLLLTARRYLWQNPISDTLSVRFDVIAITLPGGARPAEINHIKGAFTGDE